MKNPLKPSWCASLGTAKGCFGLESGKIPERVTHFRFLSEETFAYETAGHFCYLMCKLLGVRTRRTAVDGREHAGSHVDNPARVERFQRVKMAQAGQIDPGPCSRQALRGCEPRVRGCEDWGVRLRPQSLSDRPCSGPAGPRSLPCAGPAGHR